MKNQRLFTLLSITVIFVFITSLFATIPALADDSTPPAPTEEPAQPPTEEPATGTEAAPTPTPEADTQAEILEAAPEGVDVIVLDENGEPMSMVTEEVAQIIMAGDPIWCPNDLDGTPQDNPLPGVLGCTLTETTFTGLLIHLNTGAYSGAGTIFVSWDYSASEGLITLDHSVTELNGLTDLTIQGGWVSGVGVDTSLQSTLDGTWLSISNWGGNVTINNIFINNAGASGLYISTDGDVELNYVDVNNSYNYGAYIETDGNVTIIESNFNNTKNDAGLIVENGGSITLANVNANGNYDDGAILDNGCGCASENIFVSSSNFDSNGIGSGDGRGLITYSNGDITLTNTGASGNVGGGVEVDNATGGGSGSITLNGTNIFNNDGFGSALSVGLYAVSNGNITLSGIAASGNGADYGGGAFVVGSNSNVSITNSNFSNNCISCEVGFGLFVLGSGGDITLNGVTANSNGNDPTYGYTGPVQGFGAFINNATGNTFVANSSFSNNCTLSDCSGGGIRVMSYGNIYFDHVDASGNGLVTGGGANIASDTGNIDIYCSSFNNNVGYGILADVLAGNTLTLNGVTITGNSLGDLDFVGGSLTIDPGAKCKKEPLGPTLPLNIVNTDGGESIPLECAAFRGTKLILPSGDMVIFPCPLQDEGRLDIVTNESLPGKLPEGNAYVSGLTTHLITDGKDQVTSDPAVVISFLIPASMKDAELTILFWDGSKWIEIGGFNNGNGHFDAFVNSMGTYVLVSK